MKFRYDRTLASLAIALLFSSCGSSASHGHSDVSDEDDAWGEGDDDADEAAQGGKGGDSANSGGKTASAGGETGGGGSAAATGGSGVGAQTGKGGETSSGTADGTAKILGTGDHTASSVKLVKLGTSSGCLVKPTDLAFNPRRPDELWVVNYGDDSVCIVMSVKDATLRSERRQESSHEHFLPRPMGLAFGGDKTSFNIPGTFATANDSAGDGNPDDGALWNGITLWSSDLNVFGKFKGPDGNSHLDMLHDSPLARGIAWEKDNIYWVFGGTLQDITRYDFASDHERGHSDHSDGLQWHYAAGKVKGVNGVPSHLAYDAGSKMLYIADTGNSRVARLDTTKGTVNPKRHTRPMDRAETRIDAVMDGVVITDFVAAGGDLKQPAGIEVWKDIVIVSDHATGHIHAFDLQGKRINWIDTGLGAGALGGVTVGADGKVYFAATSTNAIYSLTP